MWVTFSFGTPNWCSKIDKKFDIFFVRLKSLEIKLILNWCSFKWHGHYWFMLSIPCAITQSNIDTYFAFSLSKCFWCLLLSSLAVTLDISICTFRIFNAVIMKNVELQLIIKMIGRYKYKNSDSRDSAKKNWRFKSKTVTNDTKYTNFLKNTFQLPFPVGNRMIWAS